MTTSQIYIIDADTPEGMREQLNDILARIADRLDALSAVRGSAELHGKMRVLDSSNTELHGFSNDA